MDEKEGDKEQKRKDRNRKEGKWREDERNSGMNGQRGERSNGGRVKGRKQGMKEHHAVYGFASLG